MLRIVLCGYLDDYDIFGGVVHANLLLIFNRALDNNFTLIYSMNF